MLASGCAALRGGLAHAGLAGQQAQTRRPQQPVEALVELFECAFVPGLGYVLAQARRRSR